MTLCRRWFSQMVIMSYSQFEDSDVYYWQHRSVRAFAILNNLSLVKATKPIYTLILK